MVKDVWWYKEWHISETSLESLLVVVIVRVIQNNLSKLRDPYLHNNCLAILSNCAPYFVSISGYAAMRLVNVVTLITMKCSLLKESEVKPIQKEKNDEKEEDNSVKGATEEKSSTNYTGKEEDDEDDEDEDLPTTTYSGFLRAILSIISTTLSTSIEKNPHLVLKKK